MAKRSKLEGLDKVKGSLTRLPDQLRAETLEPAVRARAQMIVDRAIQLAPVASGKLRDAIQVVATETRGASVSVTAGIPAQAFAEEAFYPAFVEYGTERMDARLFMTRAFEQTVGEVEANLSREVVAGVDRILGN